MAGHNKWTQIKHKKSTEDAKRSVLFSRLGKQITTESRLAKGVRESPGLRAAIERARAANMPKENIERAILKGIGTSGNEYQTFTYELYGPEGCAIIVVALSDNNNRMGQELRHIVSEFGFALTPPKSVAWAFGFTEGEWRPTTTIPLSQEGYDALCTLCNAIAAHDDVVAVTHNAIVS